MKTIRNLVIAFGLVGIFAIASAQTSYEVDPGHTSAYFRTGHLGVSYAFGRFDETAGTLVYNAENPEQSSLEFLILVESVNTNIEQRDGHLKSPDFFDAAQFPAISFTSTNIATTDQENVFEVTGDLSAHGVTNEITIMVEKTGEGTDQQGRALIGFYTEFDINRADYGMTNLLPVTSVAGNDGGDVRIMFSFEGIAN